eukprot:6180861-Pleurochrysis_carterae.AAC.2
MKTPHAFGNTSTGEHLFAAIPCTKAIVSPSLIPLKSFRFLCAEFVAAARQASSLANARRRCRVEVPRLPRGGLLEQMWVGRLLRVICEPTWSKEAMVTTAPLQRGGAGAQCNSAVMQG